jgi:hypothetical protein
MSKCLASAIVITIGFLFFFFGVFGFFFCLLLVFWFCFFEKLKEKKKVSGEL